MRDWSGFDIADWLIEQGVVRKFGSVQDCDGLTPHEGVTFDGEPINDGYFWVTSFVDLDYMSFLLIDVRSHTDDRSETRDYLAIGIGGYRRREVEWWNRPRRVDEPWEEGRLGDALTWFAGFIEEYLRHDDELLDKAIDGA